MSRQEYRPEFCETVDCLDYHRENCPLNNWINGGWQSSQGRKREKERLNELAKVDPQAIINACKQGGFN